MNQALRKYFSKIGTRGGRVISKKKKAAVRNNGALGGRPRKDGMPPGSKPLEVVVEWITSSDLVAEAKREMKIWARWKASLFKDGEPWLKREDVVKIAGVTRKK